MCSCRNKDLLVNMSNSLVLPWQLLTRVAKIVAKRTAGAGWPRHRPKHRAILMCFKVVSRFSPHLFMLFGEFFFKSSKIKTFWADTLARYHTQQTPITDNYVLRIFTFKLIHWTIYLTVESPAWTSQALQSLFTWVDWTWELWCFLIYKTSGRDLFCHRL